MRPHLLYRTDNFYPQWGMLLKSPSSNRWRDREFEKNWEMLSYHNRLLIQDLELDVLFQAMAKGDQFLLEVVKNVILVSTEDTSTILYRQNILKDCIENPEVVREVYTLAYEAIEGYLQNFSWYSSQSADSVRSTSIRTLEHFTQMFSSLRKISDVHANKFKSEGFKNFFALLDKELSDEYLHQLNDALEELSLPNGMLISSVLGKGNKGSKYELQRYRGIKKQKWFNRIFSKDQPTHFSFTIADRDISGFRALAEIRGRSVNTISNILLQSSDHIFRFFTSLKIELAFYIGCLNLKEHLKTLGEPFCFPVPMGQGSRSFSFKSLYDICLALQMENKVIGNEINADNKDLILITGANRGGKSTFLRSIGLAQMMMQSGSFVPAESFCSDVCRGIFTHFKREEDHSMKSGKFDEELHRMSQIVDKLKPDSMILFNESFAATNEREGSEISRQIVTALLKRKIKVIFVTHLYEFSHSLYERKMQNALFLRAERKTDGERTFRITEGEPLQTSFGQDLYNKIFINSAQGIEYSLKEP